MSESTRDVVISGTTVPLTELAYTKFDQARIELIQAAIGVAAPPEKLYAFLELSARYDLDPLTGEIWLAPMSGTNGAPGRIAILVGRDGYLKIARRDTAFIDVDADVVYDQDEFRVTRKADGTRTVEHSYGNPAKRGEAVGAYAVLRREGKPDRYFYAPLEQYAKRVDKSAWGYRDAMAIKAATSYITRLTYGVSGPVPADEIAGGVAFAENIGNAGSTPASFLANTDLGRLVARAEAIDPKAWRANEVEARLPDPEDRNYDRVVGQITAEVTAWLEENEPADAVVVADAPAPEGIDVAGELQRRWVSDAEWRAQVEPLLNTFADYEAELDAAVGDGQHGEEQSIRARMAEAEEALDALGVPVGWWPETTAVEA